MKESIATIRASENCGSLMANATSKTMFNFASQFGLSAAIFLMSSSAQANTAHIAYIRDVNSGAEVVREVDKLEDTLKRGNNEYSYTRKGNEFTVAFR